MGVVKFLDVIMVNIILNYQCSDDHAENLGAPVQGNSNIATVSVCPEPASDFRGTRNYLLQCSRLRRWLILSTCGRRSTWLSVLVQIYIYIPEATSAKDNIPPMSLKKTENSPIPLKKLRKIL